MLTDTHTAPIIYKSSSSSSSLPFCGHLYLTKFVIILVSNDLTITILDYLLNKGFCFFDYPSALCVCLQPGQVLQPICFWKSVGDPVYCNIDLERIEYRDFEQHLRHSLHVCLVAPYIHSILAKIFFTPITSTNPDPLTLAGTDSFSSPAKRMLGTNIIIIIIILIINNIISKFDT